MSTAAHLPDFPTPLEETQIQINVAFDSIRRTAAERGTGSSTENERRYAAEILREAQKLAGLLPHRDRLLAGGSSPWYSCTPAEGGDGRWTVRTARGLTSDPMPFEEIEAWAIENASR